MAVAEGMGAALGVAGTWADSAAPECSGFGSGFAGSHFGAALGLALFGLVLASFAGKAAADDEQGRKACMHDALTVCAKFIPDREQIANCLMANRERISQSCRVLLARAH
jgi:hypothetical protein